MSGALSVTWRPSPRDSETTYMELSAAGMTEPAKSLAVVLSAAATLASARTRVTRWFELTVMLP
jgi:hypothetical protein